MRLICPDCKKVVYRADADTGREVECPHCRGTIPVPVGGDEAPRWEADAPSGPWRGRGVTALVLGLLSVPGIACGVLLSIFGLILGVISCGLGGLFGIFGLILGMISLRTPSRVAGAIGALFSAVGVMLSLGMMLLILTQQSALTRPVPPAADGTPPPFSGRR